jgi:uncharacterized protein
MSEAGALPFVFLVGVAAAVIGATVGGGSLLSIPVLILVGLPPHVAIATDRFSGLGAALTALHRFSSAGKIEWHQVPALAALSLVGSLIGASLLTRATPELLQNLLAFLLLSLLPLVLLSRHLGLEPRPMSPGRKRLGLVCYFAIQLLAGFFSAGTAPLIFYVLIACFGLTIIQASATQVIPFLVLALASSLVFAWNGLIDYRVGLVLLAGTTLGGYLGASLAVRSGELWIRRAFALGVTLAAARLFFGS